MKISNYILSKSMRTTIKEILETIPKPIDVYIDNSQRWNEKRRKDLSLKSVEKLMIGDWLQSRLERKLLITEINIKNSTINVLGRNNRISLNYQTNDKLRVIGNCKL